MVTAFPTPGTNDIYTAGIRDATFRDAPSYVTVPRTNMFDPVECTYNWKPSNTKRFRAGLARAAAGYGFGEILAVGDSLMAGSTKTDGTYQVKSGERWLDYWQNRLVREGIPKGGTGMVRVVQGAYSDSRVSATGTGWVNGGTNAYTTANGAAVNFVSDYTGDTIDIWAYMFGDTSTFTVSVNGATSGTGFSTQTTAGMPVGWHKFIISTPVLSGQSIVITKASGNYMDILAVQVRNNAAMGLLVHNVAQPGATAYGTAGASSWGVQSTSSGTLWWDYLANFYYGGATVNSQNLSAVLIGLGANDIQQAGYSQANTIAAIQAIAGLFPNADVVLVATTPVASTTVSDVAWQTYVNALHTLADTLDVPLIDQRRRAGAYTDAVNLGLTVDGQGHMLSMGNAFVSGEPAQAVTPVVAAPAGLPSYAPATAKNRYDPMTNVYNFKASNTRKAHAAIARAQSGGKMNILAIGDSSLVGYNGTDCKESRGIPRNVGKTLAQQLGILQAGSGMIGTTAAQNIAPTDVRTVTGTIADQYGTTMMYPAATMTVAPEQSGTSIEVYYANGGTGTFTVSVDGAAAVTVTPTGASSMSKYTVSGLTDTKHTVKVTNGAGYNYITAVAVQRASGIAVHNMAWGGANVNLQGPDLAWLDTSAGSASEGIRFQRKGAFDASGIVPDLVLICLGANDLASGDTSVNIRTGLVTMRGWYPNSDYLFILGPGLTTVTQATMDAFTGDMYTFADTVDCPIFDGRDRFGYATEANANGLIGADGYHGTAGYQRENARIIANLYAGGGPGPVYVAPSGAVNVANQPDGTFLAEF